MATTYLQLANEVLREMNEVELTSTNFGSSTGIQSHVKDAINRAYFDIVNEEPQWPFLSAGESGNPDPNYGNVYIETVAGTRWYELLPSSSSITTDYGYIDLDKLRFTSIEEWKDYLRLAQNQDDADTQNQGVPDRVIRSPDSRNFGLSPIPDKVYRVFFYAYNQPTALSAHSDEIVFPDTYSSVLIARTRYYVYQFKENPQMSAFSLEDYKRGLKLMRLHLMEPTPGYFKDDRMRMV